MYDFILLTVFPSLYSSWFKPTVFVVQPHSVFFVSQELITTVRYCLDAAEKRKMTSLSFPAIGTGNLGFPRDLVSRVLLREIHSFSQNKNPRHLREVVIVVHPSDSQTVDVSFHFVEDGVFECLSCSDNEFIRAL